MALRASLRRWIRRLHLIGSLTLGLLFVAIAGSGSIITFRHEIDRWLHPPAPWNGEDMGFAAARQQALSARPGMQLQMLWFPTQARPYYEAAYHDDQQQSPENYRFHPADGRVLPRSEETLMEWMTTFHLTLHLGSVGHWLVQHTTLLSLVLIITGVWLWWPGWKPKLWFKVRRRGGLFAYDVHRVSGLASTPVLLLCTTTGLAWAFPNAARTIVWAAVGRSVPSEQSERVRERQSTPPPSSTPVIEASDEQLLADAQSRAPEGAIVFYITYPIEPTESRQVRMQVGYSPYPYGKVYRYYYDRYSGQLLGAVDPRLAPAPDAFLDNWTDALHYGTWGGVTTQVLYLLATLTPFVLAYTGLVLWRKRVGRAVALLDHQDERGARRGPSLTRRVTNQLPACTAEAGSDQHFTE